jgi:hypothetical protein
VTPRTTRPTRPVGVVTRGTTHPNRLRRVDAWLVAAVGSTLRGLDAPVVVDVGFGRSPITTVELAERLLAFNPRLTVVGVEIDPARVAAAQTFARPGLAFVHGGFDVADLALGPQVAVVRAFNVLRQYDEVEVAPAWSRLAGGLHPSGWVIEGTSSEIGRRAVWVRLDAEGAPHTLTFAVRFGDIERPSDLADRLPKALIHRNVPGERIHALLQSWDQEWERASSHQVFGTRQRWMVVAQVMRSLGWPVLDGPSRWRRGEFTVAWEAVRPADDHRTNGEKTLAAKPLQ